MESKKNEIPQTAKVIERNVSALLNRKKEEDRKRNFMERMVDSVTAFAGSMPSLYIHLIFLEYG